MDGVLASLPWGTLTPSALLLVVAFMVLTGRGIRTEREYLDMRQQRDYFMAAHQQEQAGHADTRAALIKSEQAGEVADAERKLILSLVKAMHDKASP